MPGVTINENTIIATRSVVTKTTDANSVYAGVPAKKIMSLADYYSKRKKAQLDEAISFAKSIIKNLNRQPVESDFREFFPLFLERNENKFGNIPVRLQTKNKFIDFMKTSPQFNSFEEFLQFIKNDQNER